MSDIVYAVHTRSCTYLLDDDGICRWVLSRSGERSDDRCVGAQFVAALDLQSRGGLVGELRIGAQALFIRSEGGRFVLIRTKPIEHVEMRGAGADEAAQPQEVEPYQGLYPEPEPLVLPSHHAVAGVFAAPVAAPEPPPPSEHRVILQTAQPYHAPAPVPPAYASPYEEEPLPDLPPPPPMVHRTEPPRAFPEPPPRYAAQPRLPAEPSTAPIPRGHTEPPPPPAPPPFVARPPLPVAPPRTPAHARRSEAQETQPLPTVSSTALPQPTMSGVPAWPPMLAPPPPQAELLPLSPVRQAIPSAEELDEDDLEEVGEDDQVYSTEVTVSLPLFRTDSRHGQPWRR